MHPVVATRPASVKKRAGMRQVFVKVGARATDGHDVTSLKRLLLATGATLALTAPIAVGGVDAAPSASASTTITVRSGDSLAGLAWRHKVDLSALLRANSLAITSVIHPGDTLVIPMPSTPSAASGSPVSSGGSTSAATGTTITVRAGDSLAGLAWRHKVSLSSFLRANSLAITSVIHPGRTLVLPSAAAAVAARPTTTRTATSGSSGGGGQTAGRTTYVVRPGDALSGIAWRHGVTLGALVAANGLSVSSVIHPGRSLSIPPATRSLPTAATGTSPTTTSTPRPSSAPATTSRSIDTLTTFLRAQVGLPYRFFSAGPRSYDCSGLVVAAFRQVGVALPHQSRALARRGTAVDWTTEAITAGDLVFTSAFNDPDRITHVGIALDSRRWIQAVGPGRGVSIGSLPADSRIMEVRRISLP